MSKGTLSNTKEVKSIGILYKDQGPYYKNLREEIKILENSGYQIDLIKYFPPVKARYPIKAIKKIFSLMKAITQIMKKHYHFYHSHDLLGIVLGNVVSWFTRGFYIRDYHELLLPPLNKTMLEEATDSNKHHTYYYNQNDCWAENISEKDLDRIEKTISLIPKGTKSILDIGCGSGDIANRLSNKYQIVGLDISRKALELLTVPSIIATASRLPFKSSSLFAWALIPNHLHLLLRTGVTPISTVMRRLLTGYAVTFNRRHRRHGHLFQNRYKSILCQEEVQK